jgi:2C-methyl-D-erythritol 2,4-cyclodiphosphate synthase
MNFEEMSDQDILEIATPIMDNLMGASTRIDYKSHVRDFSDRMKTIVTKEYLKKSMSAVSRRKRLLC